MLVVYMSWSTPTWLVVVLFHSGASVQVCSQAIVLFCRKSDLLCFLVAILSLEFSVWWQPYEFHWQKFVPLLFHVVLFFVDVAKYSNFTANSEAYYCVLSFLLSLYLLCTTRSNISYYWLLLVLLALCHWLTGSMTKLIACSYTNKELLNIWLWNSFVFVLFYLLPHPI